MLTDLDKYLASLEEVISSEATVVSPTVPAVDTVHCTFTFPELRCFQPEAPESHRAAADRGCTQLTPPQLCGLNPILPSN